MTKRYLAQLSQAQLNRRREFERDVREHLQPKWILTLLAEEEKYEREAKECR